MKAHIIKKLSTIPDLPGVYLFKDSKEKVLYVGKAKNLKKRIKSYFQSSKSIDIRKSSMLRKVIDFSFVITDNEVEALALESNFIKQYRPRFNVILRDDKAYPYMKIDLNNEWPGIEIVRKFKPDGAVYIGPYVSARGMRETLDFIRRTFPVRTCRYRLETLTRPCIQHQMGYCSAPCVGLINKEDYSIVVNDVIEFLKGNKKDLLHRLNDKMIAFSDKLMFEEAAKTRDRIRAIENAWEKQKVVSPELGDMDVIGYYQSDSEGMFTVFFVRNGILVGTKEFYIRDVKELLFKELIYSFIEQFYNKEMLIPDEIIVRKRPKQYITLKKWLQGRHGRKVNITTPADGKTVELMEMAEANAMNSYNQKKGISCTVVMKELRERLTLPEVPKSIGAFDISTISGSESVGGFIYWKEGRFIKEYYRHLRIKTVRGMDDYSMMREAMQRTFNNLKDNLPDLIIIDGGKGQLNEALHALNDFEVSGLDQVDISKINIIAIAKKPDRVFIPGSKKPIDLDDGNQSSLLLKKLRDEVHRFAITYHRKLRDKRLMKSPLEEIKGISGRRRLALLRHFRSIEEIRNSTVDEITTIKGFSKTLAENILRDLVRNS